MESNAIKELAIKSKKNTVIALGGGAFEKKSTRDWILLTGVSVWLKSSISNLTERLYDKTDRPLLMKRPRTRFRSKAELKRKLKEQLERRLPNFELAEFKVTTTNKTPYDVAVEIEKKIMKKYA